MRVLIQRVSQGSVQVGGRQVGQIGKGLVLLVGVGHADGDQQARYLAEKIANLRIFEDQAGKTNLSLLNVGGEALVVSQFTLYADTRKGRRPSFTDAAAPAQASDLVDRFARFLGELGVPTFQGEFGASMQVALVNDGPMTIWMERS